MKKLFLALSLVALVTMTMTSCLRVKVGENGWSLINRSGHHNDTPSQVHQVNTDTQMQAFDDLDVAGPFNVILEQGQASTVRVDGTVDQLGNMTIYVKDGTLTIDMKEDMIDAGKFFKGLQVIVTTPTIKDIGIAGSGKVTAPNAWQAGDINLSIAGSGNITLAGLTCQDMRIEIAGSGDVTTGMVQAHEVKTEIAGSGDIDIAGLTSQKLSNEIAGSGNMTFNNLNVDLVHSEIAGSGDIYLRGKVGSHKEDIAGSGKVHINE